MLALMAYHSFCIKVYCADLCQTSEGEKKTLTKVIKKSCLHKSELNVYHFSDTRYNTTCLLNSCVYYASYW